MEKKIPFEKKKKKRVNQLIISMDQGWVDTFFHGFKSSYPYWYFLLGFEWVIKLGSNFSKSKRRERLDFSS